MKEIKTETKRKQMERIKSGERKYSDLRNGVREDDLRAAKI